MWKFLTPYKDVEEDMESLMQEYPEGIFIDERYFITGKDGINWKQRERHLDMVEVWSDRMCGGEPFCVATCCSFEYAIEIMKALNQMKKKEENTKSS